MITDLGVIGSEPPAQESDETPRREPSRWKRPDLRRNVLIAVVLVWAVAITAVVFLRGGDSPPAPVAAPTPKPSASNAPLAVGEVYKTLLPSVVRIQAAETGAETAIGTGTIVNADGTILTANHVIAGAKSIKISYADGSSTTADVASQDAKQDIATLTPAKLPETVVPAALGGGAQVGDAVVAIGNPFDLVDSTTSGVVSGLNRSVREKAAAMTGLIQFDAAVNPGNSGGPLINDKGQVVGVVVSLANPTDAGTFIGIGFAVPIGAALGAGGTGDGRARPL